MVIFSRYQTKIAFFIIEITRKSRLLAVFCVFDEKKRLYMVSNLTFQYGASGRTRTGSVSLPMDFESIASTSFTTEAHNNGALDTIRTCDPNLRRVVLYPSELQAHVVIIPILTIKVTKYCWFFRWIKERHLV